MADQNAKTSPRRVRAAYRKQEVLRLRIAGASYRIIAEELGISRERVRKIVVEMLSTLSDVTDELREELRRLELERLDRMQLALWANAMQGDYAAVDRILKIMQRRAELCGLDAERKGELAIVHPTIHEIIARFMPKEMTDEVDASQGQAVTASTVGEEPASAEQETR